MATDTDKVDVLIVDDLPEKLLVYRSVLEELRENIVTAHSGREALKHVLQHDFAVILLDVNMPDMDGFETAGLIRGRKRSMHTPIIFVTAYVDELRAVQGYLHGAVDYILSPIAPEILRAKVKVFVDLFRMNRQLQGEARASIALAEERAKRAAAEEANRSSAFLAEASTVLSGSLDLDTTLPGLARLVVPFLADWSLVCLSDPQRGAARIERADREPDGRISTQPVRELSELPRHLARVMDEVLRTGKLQAVGPLDSAELPQAELESALVLPLSARDRTLGVLVLARRLGGHHDMLPLAEDLACRAGVAFDNALLVQSIQEADRRKDEFLAMLAHELRNPLAPIFNAVEVLRLLGPKSPEVKASQELIGRQLTHLVRLVDDLLDVSRITTGKIRLQSEILDASVAVAAAVEINRPLIDARRHNLRVSLPDEPVQVRADRARLAQVLSNLLNNAAKYTKEKGSIWLDVERTAGEAVFRVLDNGVGIEADLLPRVFDLFTQADRTPDRAEGGLGIGLTLVRRLVEIQGGTVQAFSAGLGLGSEFVVRLPAVAPERDETPPAHSAFLAPRQVRKRRVLIVDDNADNAESLAIIVGLDGHEVRTAHNGPDALRTFTLFDPQVVFLDIGLPNMDGYEVARRMRALSRHDPLVLAALTGYSNEQHRYRSLQAGFDHHLVKPVSFEELRQVLALGAPSDSRPTKP
jgi:signal transduction histidine kinase/DNA-binding response OmpR family regulator